MFFPERGKNQIPDNQQQMCLYFNDYNWPYCFLYLCIDYAFKVYIIVVFWHSTQIFTRDSKIYFTIPVYIKIMFLSACKNSFFFHKVAKSQFLPISTSHMTTSDPHPTLKVICLPPVEHHSLEHHLSNHKVCHQYVACATSENKGSCLKDGEEKNQIIKKTKMAGTVTKFASKYGTEVYIFIVFHSLNKFYFMDRFDPT